MYSNSYTLAQVNGLISQTYLSSAIWAVVILGLAILIAGLIPYEGGVNPKDGRKRRIAYWLLASLVPIAFYLFNIVFVFSRIKGLPAQDKFQSALVITTVLGPVLYIVVGLLLSKTVFSRGKFGLVFSSKR